jgi:hypothetical protein
MMVRMIRARTLHSSEVREITEAEARKILIDTYNDPLGGLIVNARTNEVIYRISPDIEEIVIIEQMLGGG